MSEQKVSAEGAGECKLGEPMMHGPQPYRWCETHNRLMMACDQERVAGEGVPDRINSIEESLRTEYGDLVGYRSRFGAALMDIGILLEDIRARAADASKEAIDEAVEQEQGRWQDAIRDKVITASQIPDADSWVDGAGCDSGDPLDVSLTEIGQVINHFVDEVADLRADASKEYVRGLTLAADRWEHQEPPDYNNDAAEQGWNDAVVYCAGELRALLQESEGEMKNKDTRLSQIVVTQDSVLKAADTRKARELLTGWGHEPVSGGG